MSEAKFTEGPWEFVADDDNLLGAGGKDAMIDGFVAGSVMADYLHVCRIWNDGPNPEEDARLIAAAPDLYEALRSAVSLLEQFVSTDDPRDETIWDARKALAKAEGKSE